MSTSEEKFAKLLAAYEDEVQRKQHKMGKRVDPTTDVAQPNPTSGYLTFLRGGQQVVWSPSFDVIGALEPATLRWTWGWADQTLDAKVRTRIDGVRKQAAEWGIDLLTNGILTLRDEMQAWELATVATAITHADAMYRVVDPDGARVRFLALFEGPPPNRSVMMRALSNVPTNPRIEPVSTASPSSPRVHTPFPKPNPSSASMRAAPPSERPPAMRPQMSSFPPPPPVPSPSRAPTSNEREPTEATRAQIGAALYDALPSPKQMGTITLMVRAGPPTGRGLVSFDVRLTFKGSAGGEQQLTPTQELHAHLEALWERCRAKQGVAFQFLTARLEGTAAGAPCQVFLEI